MRDLVERYYAAFNAGDTDAMLALLSDDVAHDVNQGARRVGREKFAEFCAHMSRCYRETLTDIVIMTEGNRAAAEFIVNGEYLAQDGDLPPANGQTYRLPAGAFLESDGEKITRVTTYYNMTDWMAQVAGT